MHLEASRLTHKPCSLPQDCDTDIRLIRRILRDTAERGRKVEEVIEQYHATVRPMHSMYVEPSKSEADLVVHNHGKSLDVAINVITNHMRAEAGCMVPLDKK